MHRTGSLLLLLLLFTSPSFATTLAGPGFYYLGLSNADCLPVARADRAAKRLIDRYLEIHPGATPCFLDLKDLELRVTSLGRDLAKTILVFGPARGFAGQKVASGSLDYVLFRSTASERVVTDEKLGGIRIQNEWVGNAPRHRLSVLFFSINYGTAIHLNSTFLRKKLGMDCSDLEHSDADYRSASSSLVDAGGILEVVSSLGQSGAVYVHECTDLVLNGGTVSFPASGEFARDWTDRLTVLGGRLRIEPNGGTLQSTNLRVEHLGSRGVLGFADAGQESFNVVLPPRALATTPSIVAIHSDVELGSRANDQKCVSSTGALRLVNSRLTHRLSRPEVEFGTRLEMMDDSLLRLSNVGTVESTLVFEGISLVRGVSYFTFECAANLAAREFHRRRVGSAEFRLSQHCGRQDVAWPRFLFQEYDEATSLRARGTLHYGGHAYRIGGEPPGFAIAPPR